MTDEHPTFRRRVLRVPAEIVVAVYVVLDSAIGPLFGPFMRGLSRLRLIRRLEGAIAGLPPYVILVLLVVPFAFAELAKVYAVLLMAEDHVRTGLTIFIGAYIVSILICERTFHAGKAQLMTIGWFKATFDWVIAIKTRVLDWFRGTRTWRSVIDLRQQGRLMARRVQMLIGAKRKAPAVVAKQNQSCP